MNLPRMTLIWVGLACFCAGGLYGWSALIGPLQRAFGVTTAQTGLVFSFAIVSFTVSVLVVPHLTRRLVPTNVVAVASILGAISLTLAAYAETYITFVVYFSGGFGGCSGAIYAMSLSIAARTPGYVIATPVMVALFGIGGAVFGPIWRLLAAGWDLTALLVLAMGICVSGGVTLLFSLKEGPPAKGDRQQSDRSSPIAMTTIILIWLTFAAGAFGGLMVLGLASKMMDVAGVSVGIATLTLAGIALGNTAGRLSVALFNSLMGPTGGLFVSASVSLLGLGLALSTASPSGLALGLICIATGYGVLASAIPSVTREAFGPENFAKVFGWVFTAWGAAGFCAPWVGGFVFDQTRSFDLAVYLALGATLCCAATSLLLSRCISRAEVSNECIDR